MPWPQTDAQLGLPDKGRTIKGLVVCNSWDLDTLDLLNGLALGCYQPSHEVLLQNKNIYLAPTDPLTTGYYTCRALQINIYVK